MFCADLCEYAAAGPALKAIEEITAENIYFM
jgi:hypothetical protein